MTRDITFSFAIDRGGTFTDVYARREDRNTHYMVKLLSEDPDRYPDAPAEGIRRILAAHGLPCSSRYIREIRMGTTVATNALLERRGAPCGLVITRGFGDLLRIGDQSRPDLFDLEIRRPAQLYRDVVEVDERLRLLPPETAWSGPLAQGVSGEQFAILKAPDLDKLRPRLQAWLEQEINSVAIVLMHGCSCPIHEELIGALARELGFTQVSLSSQVMPVVRLLDRGDTTVADAYLTPCIREYIQTFRQQFADNLRHCRLRFMQSDGGLVTDTTFRGSRAILSGPAGGVVGYGRTGFQACKGRPLIGFDMGGTSTDVSRFDGHLHLSFDHGIGGVRIRAPQLDIRTVAAGGGSRLFFANGLLRVGPASAGAHPGPVCYRKQGYVAITDANLVLGRLQPEFFPSIFGPDGDQPLDLQASRQALATLNGAINKWGLAQGNPELSVEEVALGFIRVANEMMIRPIREVSVQRGFDIQEHVLACFGGAGGQHACAIARSLGMDTVYIHRLSGILSACGLFLADVVVDRQQPVNMPYDQEGIDRANHILDSLTATGRRQLIAQGCRPQTISCTRFLNLAFQGSDTALMIAEPRDGDYGAALVRAFRREFGFVPAKRHIRIIDVRVRATGSHTGDLRNPVAPAVGPARPRRQVACFFSSGWQTTPLFLLKDLGAGHQVDGPALILQENATIVVEPGCTALITRFGDIRIKVPPPEHRPHDRLDLIRISIFANLFMSIGEQMGRMLQKTAISTNIKERCDFSCALFDRQGHLVANAPHVPVHLGAMAEAVQEQIRRRPGLQPGDVLLSNHPAAGGSHLPDLTVITPVFQNREIIFWVASRGHHADIGGKTPGSMPPDSTCLAEEGIAVSSFLLCRQGHFRDQALIRLLQGNGQVQGSRKIEDNVADLKAQVAANQKGIDLIGEMIDQHGLQTVQAAMAAIQQTAARAVRTRLQELAAHLHISPGAAIEAEDYLDDGSRIKLTLTIDANGNGCFDFTGTSPHHPGNLNAPRAVTCSAVLYCLRCLLKEDIPLNHGCLEPITLQLPRGSLLNPPPTAAVAGGNVLTSQRLVDVILKSFQAAAASQGCMNNLTFGNQHFGYYETIGGGSGAGPGWHGQSGVHTHMTNTRITDPEILERNFPVLVRQFRLRPGSGGRGRYRGGDGLVRELEFLQPMEVAILSERRRLPPYGMAGGLPGKPGRNLLIRARGEVIDLGGKRCFSVHAGDRVRICTPGGGGYGVG